MMTLKTAVWLPFAVVAVLVLGLSGEGRGEAPSPVQVAEEGLTTTTAPPWLFDSVSSAEMSARLLSSPLSGNADTPFVGVLSDSQGANALDVAQQVFGSRIVQRTAGVQQTVWQAGGAERYLDDHTVAPKGGGRLLISTTPFRYPDRSGRKVPTDVRLQSMGSSWEPRSAPVDTVIGGRLSDGVRVDGLRLLVAAGGGSDPLGRAFGENSVIYPRVAADTDAVVAATAGGAELFTILRSAQSPEQQRIAVDLPSGARLVATTDGGAQIEAADGTTRLTISAPEAEDRNGRSVPVRMSPGADGRSLVLEVSHRDREFAYPLLVDPVVSPWLDGSGNGWWFAGHREGLELWGISDGHGTGAAFAPRTTCYSPVSCYATNGLYLYAYAGYTYSAGANTGWATSLPASRTAYFKSVKFVNTYFNRRGDVAPAPFMAAGILNTTAGSWTGLTTTSGNLTNATLTIPATTGTITQGKQAWFGMFVDAVHTLPAWEDLYAGGVVLEVEDPESPTITGVTGAGGPSQTSWLRGSTSITPTATDPGLGVWQYNIAIPGLLTPGGGSVGYQQGCTGRIGDECPTSYSRTISWDTAAMPNGSNTINLWAYDASQHLSAARTWTLKIDNELPVASISGSLRSASGADVDPNVAANVHVAATDGSATTVRSGVASIAIAVDRDSVTTTQPCATTQNSCALDADRSVTPSSLAPGVHTVTVTTTDRAGNARQDSWQFNLYPTSWQYGGTDHRINTAQEISNLEAAIAAADTATRDALYAGLAPADSVRLNTSRDHTAPSIYEINRPGYWVRDPNLVFDFGGTDAESGIKVLRTFAPAVPGWQGMGSSHMLNGCVTDDGIRCVGDAHVRSVVSDLPSGLQTIEVLAADANGNERHSQFHLPVDKEAPTMMISGRLWNASGGTITGGDLQVVANDGYSGVNSIALYERLADGSRQYLTGTWRTDAQCPGYGCTPLGMTLSTTVDVGSLGFGSHRFELDIWDRSGNLNTVAWTTAIGYGGANGVVDSDAEIMRIIDAMEAATPSGRQSIWAGLSQASRDYYINRLLPDAQLNREGFGLNTDATVVRNIFNDPTTHGSISRFGAPMTTAELDYVWDDSPEGTVIDEPVNPDVFAARYESKVEADDGSLPLDSAVGGQGSGCDPQLDSTCAGDGALTTFSMEGPSDPVTDDLNATAAKTESSAAIQAGAASASWFDRYAARADANAHALTPRSGKFRPVGDADCTNFVSQVWHLGGGLHMTGRWFIKLGFPIPTRKATYSWVLVRNFVDYMVNKRQIARLITATPSAAHLPSATGIADAVEYDWGHGEGWSHLAVVVGLNDNKDDTISQHSTNRRDSTWRRGWLEELNPDIRARMRTRVVHVTVR
jgi:Putative amidase domain/Bacterial Ig-like domain (group 3)